jgi:hypothetical protein
MTEHTLADALIIDAVRTPIGRYACALSGVRPDDLAAIPLKALIARHPELDWAAVDDVILGCANQAGEDNRNVARMASLLAGLPIEVPGTTLNRLCGSGMDAIGNAARALRCGEAGLMLAGGVESMSRAPFVMGKSEQAFGRAAELFDTTIGWRFVNPLMKAEHGTDSMPETAENVAARFVSLVKTRTPSPCAASTRPPPLRPEAAWHRKSCRLRSPSAKARPSASSTTNTRVATPRWSSWPSSARRSVRVAVSPLAMPLASTTVPVHCCWRAAQRPGAMALKPAGALSAWLWPGSSRASWASVRCRLPARCSNSPGCRWPKWMSSS